MRRDDVLRFVRAAGLPAVSDTDAGLFRFNRVNYESVSLNGSTVLLRTENDQSGEVLLYDLKEFSLSALDVNQDKRPYANGGADSEAFVLSVNVRNLGGDRLPVVKKANGFEARFIVPNTRLVPAFTEGTLTILEQSTRSIGDVIVNSVEF